MSSPLVNVTLPVFNEEGQLAKSVARLSEFLASEPGYTWEVVIADNGSTDRTIEVAKGLEREATGGGPGSSVRIRVVHLDQAGRGRALKEAWLGSQADILSYMDVDLSTDLAALPPLIEGLASGRYDLAVGSRLLPGSETTRCWKRESISRGYNALIKTWLRTRLSDAQCGFKAIGRSAARALIPRVRDDEFFFDTELLVLAERRGYRILELPVRWIEDPDSRVNLPRTIWRDLKGLWRLGKFTAKT